MRVDGRISGHGRIAMHEECANSCAHDAPLRCDALELPPPSAAGERNKHAHEEGFMRPSVDFF